MKNKGVKKVSLESLKKREDWETAIIVYKQENFVMEYSLESRSYRVSRDNKFFKNYTISSSLFGSSLDDTDKNIRLDLYNWDIDYCYAE